MSVAVDRWGLSVNRPYSSTKGVTLALCVWAIAFVARTSRADEELAARVRVGVVSLRSGVTSAALERLVLAQGQASKLTLRRARGLHEDSSPSTRSCSPGARATGGTLWADLEAPDRLRLTWQAPTGCSAASIEVSWARARPEASVRAALGRLAERLAERRNALPPVERKAETEERPGLRSASDPADRTRRTSLRALESAEPRLARAVRKRLDLRYRDKADGTGGFINGPYFVREIYLEVYGIDLGAELKGQLESGYKLDFDLDEPRRTLRPGDLLFYLTYAGLPRAVMLYIGGGKVAQAARVRGVVVEGVPNWVPNYLYLVAIRPEEGPGERASTP